MLSPSSGDECFDIIVQVKVLNLQFIINQVHIEIYSNNINNV